VPAPREPSAPRPPDNSPPMGSVARLWQQAKAEGTESTVRAGSNVGGAFGYAAGIPGPSLREPGGPQQPTAPAFRRSPLELQLQKEAGPPRLSGPEPSLRLVPQVALDQPEPEVASTPMDRKCPDSLREVKEMQDSAVMKREAECVQDIVEVVRELKQQQLLLQEALSPEVLKKALSPSRREAPSVQVQTEAVGLAQSSPAPGSGSTPEVSPPTTLDRPPAAADVVKHTEDIQAIGALHGTAAPQVTEASQAEQEPQPQQFPRAPEAPQAPQAPKMPHPLQAPQAPQAPQVPPAPQAPQAPKAPQVPEAPPAPKGPQPPQAPPPHVSASPQADVEPGLPVATWPPPPNEVTPTSPESSRPAAALEEVPATETAAGAAKPPAEIPATVAAREAPDIEAEVTRALKAHRAELLEAASRTVHEEVAEALNPVKEQLQLFHRSCAQVKDEESARREEEARQRQLLVAELARLKESEEATAAAKNEELQMQRQMMETLSMLADKEEAMVQRAQEISTTAELLRQTEDRAAERAKEMAAARLDAEEMPTAAELQQQREDTARRQEEERRQAEETRRLEREVQQQKEELLQKAEQEMRTHLELKAEQQAMQLQAERRELELRAEIQEMKFQAACQALRQLEEGELMKRPSSQRACAPKPVDGAESECSGRSLPRSHSRVHEALSFAHGRGYGQDSSATASQSEVAGSSRSACRFNAFADQIAADLAVQDGSTRSPGRRQLSSACSAGSSSSMRSASRSGRSSAPQLGQRKRPASANVRGRPPSSQQNSFRVEGTVTYRNVAEQFSKWYDLHKRSQYPDVYSRSPGRLVRGYRPEQCQGCGG